MPTTLQSLAERFKSGNDIEVERIHITRKEFDELIGNQWHDIASAPKDGTVVDVWAGGRRYTDAEFRFPREWGKDGETMCWCSDYSDYDDSDKWYEIEPQPSHWIPLPAPPTTD